MAQIIIGDSPAYLNGGSEANDAIPAFWLNEVLEAYRPNITVAGLVRNDFENETGGVGDVINYLTRGDVFVNDKVVDTDITPDGPSNGKVQVILNKHKVVSWKVEDHTSAKALSQGLNYVRDAVPALIEAIEAEILEEYAQAAATAGAVGQPVDSATVREARLKLNQANVPLQNRFMILSPEDEDSLLGDPQFISAEKRGDSGSALEEARLGRIFGFDTYMSQLIPTTAGPAARHNIAMNRDGIVLAVRPLPLPPAGSGVRSGLLIDEEAGLAFRYTQGYDQTAMAMMHNVDILYGIKTVRPEAMCEIQA